jgi:uncharacterized protein YbaP (TraB family)
MTRLAAFAASLFLMLAPALAGPPLCGGSDLLARLETEDPKGYGEVMAQAAATKNGAAILWKIEKPGLRDSWLFGTAHVTDPRITRIPAEALAALEHSMVVAEELKELRKPQELAVAMMHNARLMVLPPGQSLWDFVPDDQEAAIRDNVNMPPGGAKAIFGYQPWVVAAMLSVPACENRRKQAGIASLDESLAQLAEAKGKPLVGLETVEEQLSVFAAMPIDLQSRYLLAVARLGPRMLDHFETLISLYQQRKVAAYVPLTLKIEPADDDTAAIMSFVETDLVVMRNHVMARRAADLLAHGGAFIAVGALHLPGDEGLVELIRQAGYKVTPVN